MKASETNVACPSCGAQAGAWCVRHGVTMQGTLGSCADRTRMIINMNSQMIAPLWRLIEQQQDNEQQGDNE